MSTRLTHRKKRGKGTSKYFLSMQEILKRRYPDLNLLIDLDKVRRSEKAILDRDGGSNDELERRTSESS
jgi:hypothetical protein